MSDQMMRFIVCIVLAVGLSAPVCADPAEQARTAIATLEDARAGLEAAQSSRDRVRALTATVAALEDGLASLRAGLRDAMKSAERIAARLDAQDRETAAFLAALMQMGNQGSPAIMLHPGGPTGAVRAGLIMTDLAPALNKRVASLRADAEELAQLRALQTDAEAQLSQGLSAVQQARASLSDAIAERTEPPKRFINDPVREAILIASADSLAKFADGLDRIAVDEIAPAAAEMEGEKGSLSLPVRGHLVRGSNEADAAGVTRPGILLATQSDAIVTTPVSASVRYAGPLLDLGQVVILEPQEGVLFILSGLGAIYPTAGDVVAAGAPLGLMSDEGRKNATKLSTDGDDTGVGGPERLYIEVRQDNVPEDPTLWFQTDKDG